MGEYVLGGPPLATMHRPYVERGWIKQCRSKDEWSKQPINKVNTQECGFTPLNTGK